MGPLGFSAGKGSQVPIEIGIIGCGAFMAYQHVGRLLGLAEVEIVGLADPNADAVARLRKKFRGLKQVPHYSDHRALLKTARPDAVAIATPHALHVQHILDSFDAGCHVMVDKPMVCSVKDAKRVLARRDKTGKVLLVSFQRHYLPHYRYGIDAITAGELGEIQFVTGVQSQGWLKLTKGTWRQDPSYSGGGQLIDSGSHLLDYVLHATGLDLKSVKAYSSNLGAPVNINSALAFSFTNGALGSISIVGNAQQNMWEDISFYGSKGSLLMRSKQGQSLSEPEIFHENYRSGRVEVTLPADGSDPDANFIDAILGRAEVRSTGEDGLRAVELVAAAHKSAETGREVRLR